MREIEKGDTVISHGTVLDLDPVEGMYRITSPDGATRLVCKSNYQLVEPKLFEVGDKVVTAGGYDAKVVGLYRHPSYNVVFPDGTCSIRHIDELTPAPPEPKPEYRVTRENDELRLQRIHDNPQGLAATWVSMSDPEKVEATIVEWARDFRIDADVVRKLAAEPRIIDRDTLGEGHHVTGIRHGSGWYVTLTTNYVRDLDSTYLPGAPQPESIGKAIFPGTNGPYKAKP